MEKLKEKINSLYVQYVEFEKLVNEKNQSLVKDKKSILDMSKDKNPEEIEKVIVHLYSDAILYNSDSQMLFTNLMNSIEIYQEIGDGELSEEVNTFYKTMKQFMPKRVFAVEKGEIVETEKGVLEEQRKKFLEGDFFKQIKQQLGDT